MNIIDELNRKKIPYFVMKCDETCMITGVYLAQKYTLYAMRQDVLNNYRPYFESIPTDMNIVEATISSVPKGMKEVLKGKDFTIYEYQPFKPYYEANKKQYCENYLKYEKQSA